jgi:hypothetical protein
MDQWVASHCPLHEQNIKVIVAQKHWKLVAQASCGRRAFLENEVKPKHVDVHRAEKGVSSQKHLAARRINLFLLGGSLGMLHSQVSTRTIYYENTRVKGGGGNIRF